MRLLALWLPDLAISLARRSHPELAERPLALLQGAGPAAVVSAVSPAAARSLYPGMRAGEARSRSPGAVFLPDNASACLDELERLASILRKYATVSVAIDTTFSLLLAIPAAEPEEAFAQRLLPLVRAWSGVAVQAAIGSTPADAREAARVARRGVGIAAPREGAGTPLRATEGPISLEVAFDGTTEARRRALAALARLATLQQAFRKSFRVLRLTFHCGEAARTMRLTFDRPADVDDARERVEAALALLPAGQAGRLTVALERLGPRVAVEPLPTLAAAG